MNRVIYIYRPSACHMYCISYIGASLQDPWHWILTVLLHSYFVVFARRGWTFPSFAQRCYYSIGVLYDVDSADPSSLKRARFNSVTSRRVWNHRERPHDLFKLSKKSTSLNCCLLKVKHAANVLQIWSTAWTPLQEIRSDEYTAITFNFHIQLVQPKSLI